MDLDLVTTAKLDKLREEMIKVFGKEVTGVATAAMSAAMHTLHVNAMLNDLDVNVCLDAYIESVKEIDRLSNEETERLKNAKNN